MEKWAFLICCALKTKKHKGFFYISVEVYGMLMSDMLCLYTSTNIYIYFHVYSMQVRFNTKCKSLGQIHPSYCELLNWGIISSKAPMFWTMRRWGEGRMKPYPRPPIYVVPYFSPPVLIGIFCWHYCWTHFGEASNMYRSGQYQQRNRRNLSINCMNIAKIYDICDWDKVKYTR